MYVSYWFMSFSIIIWEWYINFVIAKEISIRKSFHFRFCFLFSFLFRFRFLNWYESHLDQMVVLDDSKNSSQETSSSFSCLSPISFSHSISVKLTNSNFLSRKQQILVAVRGYKRQHFLDNSIQKKKKSILNIWIGSNKINYWCLGFCLRCLKTCFFECLVHVLQLRLGKL